MVDCIDEAKARAAAIFIHFSDILKKGVMGSDGKLIGAVWDISVRPQDTYPAAEDLIICKGFFKRSYASVPWRAVSALEDGLILEMSSEEIRFGEVVKGYKLLIRRDILDQQVVDIYNRKVRRVNDVHLLEVDHELVVVHVDTGLRGLVRRLGWESCIDSVLRIVAENSRYLKGGELVSWKYIQPVSVNPASMTMKLSVSEKQLLSIPAADLGDIIFDLGSNQRMALFRALDIGTKAKVFENLDFKEQKRILRELDNREAAKVLAHVDHDKAASILERLTNHFMKDFLAPRESKKRISRARGG